MSQVPTYPYDVKDRLELLRWLINRCDTLRAAYSMRANIVVAADAVVLNAIAIILVRAFLEKPSGVQRAAVWLLLGSASLTALSLLVALLGPIVVLWHNPKYGGPARLFLNPPETFKVADNFDKFAATFNSVDAESLTRAWLGELFVDLRLQQTRYDWLRRAAMLLAPGVALLVMAVTWQFARLLF